MGRYRPRTIALVILGLSIACGKSTTTAKLVASPSASASPKNTVTVRAVNHAPFGKILVDAKGRTLYHFDRDSAGKVACTEACTATWPPLLLATATAPTGVADLGTVKRPDGGTQVTYNGMPLYRYSVDMKPGEANGDGVGGVWHVARVATNMTPTPAPAVAPARTNAPTRTSAPATAKPASTPQPTPYGSDPTPTPGPPNVPGPPGY